MKYLALFLSVFTLSGLSSQVNAGDQGPVSTGPENATGMFIGIGGGYNWMYSNSTTTGTLDAVRGVPPNGIFSGSSRSWTSTGSSSAFELQAGYFQEITESPWLWGFSFFYQNTNTIATNHARRYINLKNRLVGVTDQIKIAATQTKVTDELMLPVFAGYSLPDSFVYLGVGPALFRAQHSLYASSDAHSALYIGNLGTFSNTNWVWGGAAQAGLAYYIDPTWFLNLHYTWAGSANYAMNRARSFSPDANGGLNAGTLAYRSTQRLITQELGISINKVFDL